jgi:hypothetical protein
MTFLKIRYCCGDLEVTRPDIETVTFKTEREAWAWCLRHHPGSPVKFVRVEASRQQPIQEQMERGDARPQ